MKKYLFLFVFLSICNAQTPKYLGTVTDVDYKTAGTNSFVRIATQLTVISTVDSNKTFLLINGSPIIKAGDECWYLYNEPTSWLYIKRLNESFSIIKY